MSNKKALTEEDVLEQIFQVFPEELNWEVTKDRLTSDVSVKVPFSIAERMSVIVEFNRPRIKGAASRDKAKPPRNRASVVSLLSVNGPIASAEGPNCVMEVMEETRHFLLDRIESRRQEHNQEEQLLKQNKKQTTEQGQKAVASGNMIKLTEECDRCEGAGHFKLFTSVEDPCIKCDGKGKVPRKIKQKLGTPCYNPDTLTRFKPRKVEFKEICTEDCRNE